MIETLDHALTIVDFIRAAVELFLGVCSMTAGAWLIWRKVKKSVQMYTSHVDEMTGVIAELVKDHGTLTEAQEKLTHAMKDLVARLEVREKDIARLEGAMDATRKDMVQLVGSIQQASGSLDGVWRTLQALFPHQVPKRASDK